MSLLTDLRAFWRGDDADPSTGVADSSGNGSALTPLSATDVSPGAFGAFGAVEVYETALRTSTNLVTSGPFTCAAFVRVSPGTWPEEADLFRDTDADGDGLFRLVLPSEDGVRVPRVYDPSSPPGFAAGPAFAEDEWHHVAVVSDGTHVTVYTDGVAGDPVAVTLGHSSGGRFLVGRGSPAPFNGRVSLVGVWGRALSACEVGQLYNSGGGFDPTA